MTLLLYIWGGPPAEVPYSPAALAELKQAHPQAPVLTMDTASDAFYRQRLIEVMQEAEAIQAIVAFPPTPVEDTRGLRPILEQLLRHRNKASVEVTGENRQLAPMLRHFEQAT